NDVGLERIAALAAWDAPRIRGEPRARVLEGILRAAGKARTRCDRAVHLDQLACPSLRVQPVHVLRDHGVEHAAALELHQRRMRAVGLLVAQGREALAVEAPEALRVAAEGIDV